MSIQPIDLQTLFVRLGQVGREQSAIKDAVAQNQAVVGGEIAQRSQEESHTVRRTEDVSEGTELVNDEENRKQEQDLSGSGGQKSADDQADDDYFKDPELGQNVDLSG